MKRLFVAVFTLMLLNTSVSANNNDNSITIGKRVQLDSKVLKEQRELLIYTPDDYSPDKQYHVIYLLDGGVHFIPTVGILKSLMTYRIIPETILVAVKTTNRARDFLPPLSGEAQSKMQKWTQTKFPQFGGSDQFLSFFENELFPYIDKHYSVTPHKTLIGHSNGAVLSLYSMLSKPRLFDNYLAISPAPWWSEGQITQQLKALFKAHPDFDSNLYLTVGEEGKRFYGASATWSVNLALQAPKSFNWQFNQIKQTTHNSVIFPSIYRGLQALYSEFTLPELDQMAKFGEVTDVIKHYKNLSSKYGYKSEVTQSVLIDFADKQFAHQRKSQGMETLYYLVKQFPQSSHAHKNLADGYMKTEQYGKAKQSYEKALAIVEKLNLPDPFVADAIRDMVKGAQAKM